MRYLGLDRSKPFDVVEEVAMVLLNNAVVGEAKRKEKG